MKGCGSLARQGVFLRLKITIYEYFISLTNMSLTYDIDQAADFLKINKTTMGEMAATGILPAAKIGIRWVFMERDLIAHLSKAIEAQTLERRRQAAAKKPPEKINSMMMRMTMPKSRRRNPLPDLSKHGY